MTNDLLIALQMWIQEVNTNRTVNIELGKLDNKEHELIWVYDFNVTEGAFIKTIEDLETLDLKEKKKQRAISEYKKAMGEE